MKPEDFKALVKARNEKNSHVLLDKNREYSRNGERLHNFYVAAAMMGVTPEDALWGMAAKHIVSIQDMVDDVSGGKWCPSEAQVDEKIGDLMNYCHLLEALFADRREAQGDK